MDVLSCGLARYCLILQTLFSPASVLCQSSDFGLLSYSARRIRTVFSFAGAPGLNLGFKPGFSSVDVSENFTPLGVLRINSATERDNFFFEFDSLRCDFSTQRVTKLGECFSLHLRLVAFCKSIL